MPLRRYRLLFLAGLVAAMVAAVLADEGFADRRSRARAEAMTGGDVARGKLAFARYGCGGCHSLSGIAQAHGGVGPPLDGVGARAIVAGRLRNEPDNLEQWIRNPQKIRPGTAMPDLGVTPNDARDLAAFLYTKT